MKKHLAIIEEEIALRENDSAAPARLGGPRVIVPTRVRGPRSYTPSEERTMVAL